MLTYILDMARGCFPGIVFAEVLAEAAAADLEMDALRHKPEDKTGAPGAVSDGMVRALSSREGVSLAVANPKPWITFFCASALSLCRRMKLGMRHFASHCKAPHFRAFEHMPNVGNAWTYACMNPPRQSRKRTLAHGTYK